MEHHSKPCLTPARTPFKSRWAGDADNATLVELTAACPMGGALSLCIHRSPDFFALNWLEGDPWKVAVVEPPGGSIVGCIAAAERSVWLDGRVARVAYVSDLKVHPGHRGAGAADALCLDAWDWCRTRGSEIPVLVTVLSGNQPMESRFRTGRCMPPFSPIGMVRVYTVPLLWRRRSLDAGTTVSPAAPEDLEEMMALWERVSRDRQFAPALDAAELTRWIARAPGLSLSDYRVARDRNERIVGFIALWDQEPLKQLQVVGLTPRGALFRRAFNAAAPLCGSVPLPQPGNQLRCRACLHVCVPADRPDVLHRLLGDAYRELRGRYSFFTVGLDVRDPLTAALKGFRAFPADVEVLVSSADGCYAGPRLRDRPIHFETGLV